VGFLLNVFRVGRAETAASMIPPPLFTEREGSILTQLCPPYRGYNPKLSTHLPLEGLRESQLLCYLVGLYEIA